jgi:hypothetical protein
MAVRRTWWVKLRRAEKHLGDFKGEFVRLRDTDNPYRISYEIHSHNNMDWLTVRGYLHPLPDDGDDIAAIIGDFVANTRAAMDHICVALTGRDDVQFPIFVEDIWKPDIDPRTGKDRNQGRRNSFAKNTRGMPADALALIERLQPHAASPQNPEGDALALLNRISNADKHRTLMTMSRYIYSPTITVNGPGLTESVILPRYDWKGMDGAVIATIPGAWPVHTALEVKASGGVEIGLKEAPSNNLDWEVPDTLNTVLKHVQAAVIKPLDGYIR